MPQFYPLESKLRKMGYFCVAGIDEAGRGPLAGPVVSAAVILRENVIIEGLNDSKLLSASKREKLFPEIIEKSVDYAISIVPHSIIDEINILNAVRFANKLAIDNLKIKADIAVIDGRDKQFLEIPFQTIIKGDQRIQSIAAASILAKVTRDRLMVHYSKKFPNYYFEKHMGYGTRQHRTIIKELGSTEIHRKSFKVK